MRLLRTREVVVVGAAVLVPSLCAGSYKMMLSCWHPKPEDRPSFTELRTKLERSLEVTESYIDLNIAVSEDYYHHDAEST